MPENTAIITPANWTEPLVLEQYFDVSRPLEVDIGCGKGRFLMATAGKKPETNFLGIDRMASRLEKVDKKVQLAGLTNVRLLRIENSYAVKNLLSPGSISTFHIFFPDPWPKRRHHKKRMINSDFVISLHERLKTGGTVNFATDHMDYFEWSCKIFRNNSGFAEIEPFVPEEDERTNFEMLFMGQDKPIGRCSFRKK